MCMLLLCLPLQARKQWTLADSLIERVRQRAPEYFESVQEYRAQLKVKGDIHIGRKNALIRYLPHMFRVKSGVHDYQVETHSDLHYTAPDIYDEKMRFYTGTPNRPWEADGRLDDFFHINVYASSLLGDKLLSPLAHNGRRYFKYQHQGVEDTPNGKVHRIYFVRKVYSFQLLYGYIFINENSLTVREICYIGHTEMNDFDIKIKMGEEGTDKELLPVRYEVEVNVKWLGNKLTGKYVGVPEYEEIVNEKRPHTFDLTDAYTLSTDTTSMVRVLIQEDAPEPQDSLKQEKAPREYTFWEGMEDILFSRRTVNMQQYGSLRINELLDPSLLGYSRTNGISYRYKIRYNRVFSGDRLLSVTPRLGFNFNHREFYWRVNGEYTYNPQKRSKLILEMGSGGRIYSQRIINAVNEMPDNLFDKDQIHVNSFKDLYAQMLHSWEITNGLTLQFGLMFHQRTAVKDSKLVLKETGEQLKPQQAAEVLEQHPEVTHPELITNLRHYYNSLAPRVILQWVPGQYYYMNGQRKENLHSLYPQFTFDWERGIKGILKNSMRYERMEFSVQHVISLGIMRELYWSVAAGAFTNTDDLFFADFEYLRRNNLPDEWRDEISGRFQLLRRQMYNSSSKYARMNFTYDTPFFLVPHWTKLTKHIIYERVYLNMLWMPEMTPYWELGWGFGTHVIDLGFFASFDKTHYQRMGVKISYQLFKR